MDKGKNKTKAAEGATIDLAQALHELADALREATECLLDLQDAVQALHLQAHPALSRAVDRETDDCLRAAMRRGGLGAFYQRR